ncbi:hypothetical protein CCYA_CCYA07G2122 [Cyanidiococcus yangmingshanensis]|nr:hypothetical protein CCYA_CCYA07G2122 [Cyanidiococcus yangmingshanensis]
MEDRRRRNKLMLQRAIRIGIRRWLGSVSTDRQRTRRRTRNAFRGACNDGWLLERLVRAIVLRAFGFDNMLRPRNKRLFVDNWARQRSLTDAGFMETLKQAFQSETDELILHIGPLILDTSLRVHSKFPNMMQLEGFTGIISLKVVLGLGMIQPSANALPGADPSSEPQSAVRSEQTSEAVQMRTITQRFVKVPFIYKGALQVDYSSTASVLNKAKSATLCFDMKSELLALLGKTSPREYPLVLISVGSPWSRPEMSPGLGELFSPGGRLEWPLKSVWRKALPLLDPSTGTWVSSHAFLVELGGDGSSTCLAVEYPRAPLSVQLAGSIEWCSNRLQRFASAVNEPPEVVQTSRESFRAKHGLGLTSAGYLLNRSEWNEKPRMLFHKSSDASVPQQDHGNQRADVASQPERESVLRYCLWQTLQGPKAVASLPDRDCFYESALTLDRDALTCLWCPMRFRDALELILHLEATHDLAMYWPSLDEIIPATVIEERPTNQFRSETESRFRNWFVKTRPKGRHSYIIHIALWPPQACPHGCQYNAHAVGTQALHQDVNAVDRWDTIAEASSSLRPIPVVLEHSHDTLYRSHGRTARVSFVAERHLKNSGVPREPGSQKRRTGLPRIDCFLREAIDNHAHTYRCYHGLMIPSNTNPVHSFIWDGAEVIAANKRTKGVARLQALYVFWCQHKARAIRQRCWLFLSEQQMSFANNSQLDNERPFRQSRDRDQILASSGERLSMPRTDSVSRAEKKAKSLSRPSAMTSTSVADLSNVKDNGTLSRAISSAKNRAESGIAVEATSISRRRSSMKERRQKRTPNERTKEPAADSLEVRIESQPRSTPRKRGRSSRSTLAGRRYGQRIATTNRDHVDALESAVHTKRKRIRRSASIMSGRLDTSKETDLRTRFGRQVRVPQRESTGVSSSQRQPTLEQRHSSSDEGARRRSLDEVSKMGDPAAASQSGSRLFDRTYYHSFTFVPMTREEVLADKDSEVDDIDESWLCRLSEQRIDQFTDVLPVEKTLMKAWNAFVREVHPILADRSIREAALHFASWFVSRQWADANESTHRQHAVLRAAFLMHMRALWQFHLIGSNHVAEAMDAFDCAWRVHEAISEQDVRQE